MLFFLTKRPEVAGTTDVWEPTLVFQVAFSIF